MNNISIKHLRAFIEIANAGSFTRAAAALNVTQSTLTASIKLLEQQAGLKLFDRTTRQVTLSKEGLRFFPVANRLIIDFKLALDDLQAGAEQERGHITISTSPTGNSIIIPPLIKQYHQSFPKINISIIEAGASDIEQHVINKSADFGIGSNHSQSAQLLYQPLLADQYGVVVTKDHEFANKQNITWQHLSSQKMLYLTPENAIRAELEALDQQNIICYPSQSTIIEASNPNGLSSLIKHSLGIAVLPALAAQADSFRDLIFIPIIEPIRSRSLYLVSRKDFTLPPAALNMIELLNQQLRSKANKTEDFVSFYYDQLLS
ncbi:LysR family transcriptional regulator [Gammaproteobacteria bacterium AS21]